MSDRKNNPEETAVQARGDDAVAHHAEGTEMAYFTPLVDIAETYDAFLFEADLPGARPDAVDVRYDNGTLMIHAKVEPRQPRETRYHWREYDVGHYYRTFSIDTPVDTDGIKAELRDGVLRVYVPKAEAARRRRIEVRAA